MTFVQRTSTLGIFNSTIGNVSKVQTELTELQEQISSGFKSRDFEGLFGEVESFTALERNIKRTDRYEQNNDLALSRLRTQDKALTDVVSVLDDLQDLIVLARNPATRETMEFDIQANSLREQLGAALNQSFKGYYLFGGTRSDVPPVMTPVPGSPTPGVLTNNYYQGSTENASIRADDRVELEYEVRADNEAFQRAFAVFSRVIDGGGSSNDAVLAIAQDEITDALAEVNDMRTRINSDIVYIDNVNSRHVNQRLYWQGVSEEIIKTDVLAASTKVAQDQAILQASFQAFARVNQLQLADFLR